MTRKRSRTVRRGTEGKGPAVVPRPPSTLPQGGRAAIVIKCLGQCPGQGEGPQGCGDVRDRVPEGANRKGISGQGRLSSRPGEPDAGKLASPVREAAVGNVPQGNAPAAYFIAWILSSWGIDLDTFMSLLILSLSGYFTKNAPQPRNSASFRFKIRHQ